MPGKKGGKELEIVPDAEKKDLNIIWQGRVRVSLPPGVLRKKGTRVTSTLDIPEETLDLGEGAELIVSEGKEVVRVEEKYTLEIPRIDNLLEPGKKKKRGGKKTL